MDQHRFSNELETTRYIFNNTRVTKPRPFYPIQIFCIDHANRMNRFCNLIPSEILQTNLRWFDLAWVKLNISGAVGTGNVISTILVITQNYGLSRAALWRDVDISTHLHLDKCILFNENICILIRISLFVTKRPIDNKWELVQVMVWRWIGDKPLPEPMLILFIEAYMRHYGEMILIYWGLSNITEILLTTCSNILSWT